MKSSMKTARFDKKKPQKSLWFFNIILQLTLQSVRASRHRGPYTSPRQHKSLTLQEILKFVTGFQMRQEFIASLLGERFEIAD